jgi:hypothetical protein
VSWGWANAKTGMAAAERCHSLLQTACPTRINHKNGVSLVRGCSISGSVDPQQIRFHPVVAIGKHPPDGSVIFWVWEERAAIADYQPPTAHKKQVECVVSADEVQPWLEFSAMCAE